MLASTSSAGCCTAVCVEVCLGFAENDEAPTEWELVEPASAGSDPAVRDRLAQRLNSKKATKTPLERVVAAYQAGVASASLDLRRFDLVRPGFVGMQNSCWLGVRTDKTVWCADKYSSVTKQLRKERGTAF